MKHHYKGSALLIALVVIGTLVPVTLGLITLNTSIGQNTQRVVDTKIADVILSGAIDDLKIQLKALPSGNVADYYVDVTSGNSRVSGSLDINNPAFKRDHRYYSVQYNITGNYYIITSYFAGIKHAYKLVDSNPSKPVSTGEALFIRGNNINAIGSDYSVYDQEKHNFYNWQEEVNSIRGISDLGNLQIFNLSDPAKPQMIMGAGETEVASGRPIVVAKNNLLTHSYKLENTTTPDGKSLVKTPVSFDQATNIASLGTKVIGADGFSGIFFPTATVFENKIYALKIPAEGTGMIHDTFVSFDNSPPGLPVLGNDATFDLSPTKLTGNPWLDYADGGYTNGYVLGGIPISDLSPRNLRIYRINSKLYGIFAAGTRGIIIANIDEKKSWRTQVYKVPGDLHPENDKVLDVVYGNNKLYVSTEYNGLMTLDAANIEYVKPTNLQTPVKACVGAGTTKNMVINNNTLYTMVSGLNTDSKNGLYVYNIASGNAQRVRSLSCQAPDRVEQDLTKLFFDTINGKNYLISGTSNEEVFLTFDADELRNNPTNSYVSRAPLIGAVNDFAYIDEGTVNERLFVASATGIQSIDTTTVGSNTEINFPKVVYNYRKSFRDRSRPGPPNPNVLIPSKIATYIDTRVDPPKKYLYLINGGSSPSLGVYNISDSSKIEFICSLTTPLINESAQMEAVNNRLYLLENFSHKLYIYDIVNGVPTIYKTIDLSYSVKMTYNPTNFDFYILQFGTITKIDSNLNIVGNIALEGLDTGQSYLNVAVNNDNLYLSRSDYHISSYSLASPTSPAVVYNMFIHDSFIAGNDLAVEQAQNTINRYTIYSSYGKGSNNLPGRSGIKKINERDRTISNPATGRVIGDAYINNSQIFTSNSVNTSQLEFFCPTKTIYDSRVGVTSAVSRVNDPTINIPEYIRIIRKPRVIGGGTPTRIFTTTKLY